MLLAIDGTNLIHRSFHAMPRLSSQGRPTGATKGFAMKLLQLLQRFNPEFCLVVVDTPHPEHGMFRQRLWPGYKADRKPKDAALLAQFEDCRRVTEACGVRWIESCGFEADDVIAEAVRIGPGTEPHHVGPANRFGTRLVFSSDSDLWVLTDDPKIAILSPAEENWPLCQGELEERLGYPVHRLTLATAISGGHNGVPGVPGLGEKAATVIAGAFTGWYDLLEAVDGVGFVRRILAHLDSIDRTDHLAAERWLKKLRAHREQLRLSYGLATLGFFGELDRGEIGPPLGDLRRRPGSVSEMMKLWRSLTFSAPTPEQVATISQLEWCR